MRKIFFAVMFTIAVSACVTNQDSGTVIGGVAGGLLGNTIGKGSGRGIATVGGAVVGAIVGSKVGENMDKPKTVVHMPPAHYLPHPQEHECNDYITNPGAYDSCQRGVKHREHLEQKRLEREAFRRGAKK
jgi:predicted lipid-binding transport protein (Tim44 family)|tara:strand:- start:329 stop:718 length:390 start_codon:yes stop_codon:yes gene_type:complete